MVRLNKEKVGGAIDDHKNSEDKEQEHGCENCTCDESGCNIDHNDKH